VTHETLTRRRLVPAVLLAASVSFRLPAAELAPAPGTESQGSGRLRPPEFVTCDRNRLTSFTGRVVALERRPDRTVLRMETDESTRESLTLRHPAGDARAFFRMAGGPFGEADWDVILPAGRLRAGIRATAWVCANETNPKIDWERP
jgi:hypothetical protein